MKTILVDIGGTFIKRSDGRQFPISSDGSREVIAETIRRAIGPADGLDGIGVAIPGPFDFEKGIFLMDHKFAAVKGVSFRELVSIPDSVPLKFGHDVNTLLDGAVRMLALRHINTALVTLGTGLGFAYALHGIVQRNAAGSPARSLWNLPWKEGILEDAVSARGIRIAYARKTGDGTQSAYSIANKAHDGDPTARDVYAHIGTLLGKALQEYVREQDIRMILFGGQIAQSLDLMMNPLQDTLPGIEMRHVPKNAVFEGLAGLFENNKE